MKLLVTHRSPDIDAIGSLWLLRRFDNEHFGDSKLYFVNAGESIDLRVAADMGFSIEDVVHTDTGLGDFDHHQPDRGMKRICASSLVYDYVSALKPDLKNDEALKFLVEYITAIDHFEENSWHEPQDLHYQLMVHNLIEGYRESGAQDDTVVAHFGFQCLDSAYARVGRQIEAAKELQTKAIKFDTKWGKAVALESSNDEVVKLAQKSGYVIAVRKDPNKGDIRIKAVPGKDIDLTPVANKITNMDTVGRWYFHPGKTMLLNGSSKEMNRKPSPLTLKEVIEVFKSVV